MGYPKDVPIVDTMVGMPIPTEDAKTFYKGFDVRDTESKESFEFPAQYMFRNIPHPQETDDYGKVLIQEMDRFNISHSLLGADFDRPYAMKALEDHPDRLLPSIALRPHLGMDMVRKLDRAKRELGLRAAMVFAAGENPQLGINDKRYYPLYAKCAELEIPVFICAGVPGPRVPLWPQKVELLDELCHFFPELTIVTRHGCMPDVALAVQLLLKWPNLYYSTSAMAPKYYPKEIIDFANTRGADKVMYAGYFPMGLSFDRIFKDMETVSLRDDVWPKFLSENARRILEIED